MVNPEDMTGYHLNSGPFTFQESSSQYSTPGFLEYEIPHYRYPGPLVISQILAVRLYPFLFGSAPPIRRWPRLTVFLTAVSI